MKQWYLRGGQLRSQLSNFVYSVFCVNPPLTSVHLTMFKLPFIISFEVPRCVLGGGGGAGAVQLHRKVTRSRTIYRRVPCIGSPIEFLRPTQLRRQ
jgi:hypothetical protein